MIIDEDDRTVVVAVPTQDRLARGFQLVFFVCPIVALAGWIIAPMISAWVLVGNTALLAFLGIAGLGLMITARRRALRTRVVIDLGERLIELPGRAPRVFRLPGAVRVRGAFGTWSLELVGDETVTLLTRVPRSRGHALADAAEMLADELGASLEVPRAARSSVRFVPKSRSLWAALCYAPVDGLAQAYSGWALMASRNPTIRFAAKQSLAHSALELMFALVALSCCGLPMLLLDDSSAWVGATVVALPIVLILMFRTVVRCVAAYRAARGRAWVIPWLGPIARRWLPAPVADEPPEPDGDDDDGDDIGRWSGPGAPAWVEMADAVESPQPDRALDDRKTPIGDPF